MSAFLSILFVVTRNIEVPKLHLNRKGLFSIVMSLHFTVVYLVELIHVSALPYLGERPILF